MQAIADLQRDKNKKRGQKQRQFVNQKTRGAVRDRRYRKHYDPRSDGGGEQKRCVVTAKDRRHIQQKRARAEAYEKSRWREGPEETGLGIGRCEMQSGEL